MAENRYRDHWALGEFFREPYGGKQSAAIALTAALFVGYGLFAWNATMLLSTPGVVAFAASEYLPAETVRLGGVLRLLGLFWILAAPFGLHFA